MRKFIVLAMLLCLAGCGAKSSATPQVSSSPSASPIAVPVLSDQQIQALPESTTMTTLAGAPLDLDPNESTDGTVIHLNAVLPLFTTPGGSAFARMPIQQLGNTTWLPVIARVPGWVQVLLPSRPNGSTGWLDASKVSEAHTPYLVQVTLASKTLRVFNTASSQLLGTWRVGIGQPATPTPTGRTFILGLIADPGQNYSPVILPLGTHSATLDTYGGGPGTVAIHTWPDASTFNTASSHGCVRVPMDALHLIGQMPLGTLVQINE